MDKLQIRTHVLISFLARVYLQLIHMPDPPVWLPVLLLQYKAIKHVPYLFGKTDIVNALHRIVAHYSLKMKIHLLKIHHPQNFENNTSEPDLHLGRSVQNVVLVF